MVQGGFGREEIFCAVGADVCGDFRAIEVRLPGIRERLIHVARNCERVGGLPGLRRIFEELEFDRKIAFVPVDVGVDAAGVGVHDFSRLTVERSGFAVGSNTDAERTELHVDFHDVGTENLGKLAAADATEQIHLPEPVLRDDIALCFD